MEEGEGVVLTRRVEKKCSYELWMSQFHFIQSSFCRLGRFEVEIKNESDEIVVPLPPMRQIEFERNEIPWILIVHPKFN